MSTSRTDRPPPTPEQSRALAVEGSSVALSAGAGCGKTFVLAERFVRALEGPDSLPLDRIVALTFTNKAARELRERIRRECRARLDLGLETARWRSVLRSLPAAHIGTFHSFCGDVLRRYAIEAGVDPGFTVLDEPIALAIRDESLDRMLREELSRRNSDLLDLAVDYGLSMVRQSLDDLLNHRSAGDLRSWVTRQPSQLVETWYSRFTQQIQPALLANFATSLKPCLDRIDSAEFPNPKVRSRLDDFRACTTRLSGSFDPAPILQELINLAKVQGLGAKLWPSLDFYESIKEDFDGEKLV